MTSLFAPKIQAALYHLQSMGKSVYHHLFYLRKFDSYCAEHHPCESNLTKEIVWDWVYSPLHRKPDAAGIRISTVRFFGKYLNATGEDAYVFPDSMTDTKHRLSPHVFTDDELRCFFAAADAFPTCSLNPLRHRIVPVVFRLIYTCGLRPNEGRELKRANINLHTGEILITNTKHKKERLIAMSDDMLSMCRKYARHLDEEMLASEEYFFPSRNGNCYGNRQFSNLFKQCWQQANHGSPPTELPCVRVYDLRHRFASTVLNRWVDEKRDLYAMLPYLRTYMGHADMSATEYYVHLLPENLVKSAGIDWESLESVIPEVSV
jgi:site-specific recombinase XerD